MNLKEKIKQEGSFKKFEYEGYNCEIVRVGSVMGHLCGYVDLPVGHVFFGKEYDEIERACNYELIVHGGLTYSKMNEKDWRIGFDCAHLGELLPLSPYKYEGDTYRDMVFVESEIKKLVKQIKE